MKKKFIPQQKLVIRNCVGPSTESMVGNYCFGIIFFHKIGVKKSKILV